MKQKLLEGLVYSTDQGRSCPSCNRAIKDCSCSAESSAPTYKDGFLRVGLEKKGRGGKAVSIIKGLGLNSDELKALAKELKNKCGCGGSVKNAEIEIQGDKRQILKEELERKGFKVKLSGG